jgi:hypothetical protein
MEDALPTWKIMRTEWYHGRLLGQNGTINFEQNGIIKEVTRR